MRVKEGKKHRFDLDKNKFVQVVDVNVIPILCYSFSILNICDLWSVGTLGSNIEFLYRVSYNDTF